MKVDRGISIIQAVEGDIPKGVKLVIKKVHRKYKPKTNTK